MTLVKCDVVKCVHNKNCRSVAEKVEIILNHDSEGIGRIECATYQHQD